MNIRLLIVGWTKVVFLAICTLLNTTVSIAGRDADNLNDGKTIIVAAHLDDEIIWFEPLLLHSHTIVQAVMPIGPSQLRAKKDVYRDYKGSNLLSRIIHAYPPYKSGETFAREIMQPAIDPDSSRRCERDRYYGLAKTKAMLLPILQKAVGQGAKRIVTHNPWGEYGHPQHRMLSRAVRELAVDDLDVEVWFLATAVIQSADDKREYVDINNLPGVTYAWLKFDGNSLEIAREQFKKQLFFNTRIDTWTWDEGTNDFPTGIRPYIKIVEKGDNSPTIDLLKTNAELLRKIQQLRGETPDSWGGINVPSFYEDCAITEKR